jgi:hypothetical protein
MPADCDGRLAEARNGMAARALLVRGRPPLTRDKAKSGKNRSAVRPQDAADEDEAVVDDLILYCLVTSYKYQLHVVLSCYDHFLSTSGYPSFKVLGNGRAPPFKGYSKSIPKKFSPSPWTARPSQPKKGPRLKSCVVGDFVVTLISQRGLL